jgi:D-sedoheptulose 7-phosphate isomerase
MFLSTLKEHQACMAGLETAAGMIEAAADRLARTLRKRRKVLICGNGGSAADAQHFAAELIGRFEREREAWPAVALTTDTSILSAIGNDYGFENVFARQVEGLGCKGDALVAISTSGNSENVLRAVMAARTRGLHTIGLLGGTGGDLAACVDQAVVVQNSRTARIQEGHMLILHYWAMCIEQAMGASA